MIIFRNQNDNNKGILDVYFITLERMDELKRSFLDSLNSNREIMGQEEIIDELKFIFSGHVMEWTARKYQRKDGKIFISSKHKKRFGEEYFHDSK